MVGEIAMTDPIPTAEVRGTVVLEEGCVRLRSEFGATLVVVWPAATRWDEDDQAVVIDTGMRIPIGATIAGAGGYYTAAAVAQIMPSIADAVVDCLPTGAGPMTADQVVLAFPDRIVESTETTVVVGGPPEVALRSDAMSLALKTWAYCFEAACVDASPPSPLPSIGAADELEVEFPLEDWTFGASFQRSGDRCARTQKVDLRSTAQTASHSRRSGRLAPTT